MLVELAVSTAMVLLTVILHGGGLLALGRLLEMRDRSYDRARISPVSIDGAIVAVLATVGLLILHGIEIWLYAVLFRGIGAIETLRDAVYFSTITTPRSAFQTRPSHRSGSWSARSKASTAPCCSAGRSPSS